MFHISDSSHLFFPSPCTSGQFYVQQNPGCQNGFLPEDLLCRGVWNGELDSKVVEIVTASAVTFGGEVKGARLRSPGDSKVSDGTILDDAF